MNRISKGDKAAPFSLAAILVVASWTAAGAARAQCGPQWEAFYVPIPGVPGELAVVSALSAWDLDGGGPLPANLFVAGTYTVNNVTFPPGVSVYTPSANVWSSLGVNVNHPPIAFSTTRPNGELIIAGLFALPGGGSNVARWAGSAWEAVGGGLASRVVAFATAPNGDLLAATGSFSSTIRRWNGTSWSTVGDLTTGEVSALLGLRDGRIVAGGWFTSIQGVSAARIAIWDGNTWAPLGSGVSSQVTALAELPNGDIVAGGMFLNAGGVPVSFIARWDGNQWFPLGEGVNGVVRTLVVDQRGRLLVGGGFSEAGGMLARNIARWDGASWSTIGTGSFADVSRIVVMPTGEIIAGGRFDVGGGNIANAIARWRCDPPFCYSNCDNSTSPPTLNPLDFNCFLQRYREDLNLPPAQQPSAYSNCDGSTAAPVLNALDFNCFLQRYRAGCP